MKREEEGLVLALYWMLLTKYQFLFMLLILR